MLEGAGLPRLCAGAGVAARLRQLGVGPTQQHRSKEQALAVDPVAQPAKEQRRWGSCRTRGRAQAAVEAMQLAWRWRLKVLEA